MWARLTELFEQLSELSPSEREVRLQELQSEPADLLAELRSLLDAHDGIGDRFSRPAGASFMSSGSSHDQTVQVGDVLGSHEIVRRIGEGGMGTVFEAVRRDDTRQRVAIKTITGGMHRADLAARFANERRILASLQHKNIAALYDANVTQDGVPYFVMELVEGKPIDRWCNERGMPVRDRITLFRQVCSAVQHAHARLVVHRDLKPDNILVTADGTVKLLDFGIAKLLDAETTPDLRTITGYAPLTAAYASPEQVRGDTVGTATDIYSLGALLHRLLTGVTPFAEYAPVSRLLDAVVNVQPLPPSRVCTENAARTMGVSLAKLQHELSGEIDAIVLMALRKEPERRYPSVEALNADLLRLLNGQPVSARPDTATYRLRKFVARKRALVVGATIAVLAMTIGTTVALVQRGVARRQATRAERIAYYLQDILGADVVVLGPRRLSTDRLTLRDVLDSAAVRLPSDLADDPEARGSLHRVLGGALLATQARASSQQQFDSAIALHTRLHGAESIDVAYDLVLRSVATAELRPDSARQFVDRAMRIYEKRQVPDTLAIYALALRTLANIQSASGEIAAAESTLRRVITVEKRRGKDGQYPLAFAYGSIGMAQHNRGSLDSAEASMRESIRAFDAASANPTMEETMQLYSLATHLITKGRSADALPVLVRAKAMATRALPPNSAVFVQLGITLADVQSTLGDTSAAHKEAAEALALIPALPDGAAVQAFIAEWWYARMLRRERNWAQAETAARRQFASGVKAAAGFPHYLSDSYWLLGAILSDEGKYAEAESLLARSVEVAETRIGTSTPRALRGRRDLAVLELRRGHAEQAQRWLSTLPPAMADSAKMTAQTPVARH